MRVLITGGAGYVGSALADYLLDAGFEVIIFDTFSYGISKALWLAYKGAKLITGNVATHCVDVLEKEDFDAIVHLAAVVGYPRCAEDETTAYNVNVRGSAAIASLAKRKDVLVVNASTGSVYGKIDDICSEDSKLNPQSYYGFTKQQAERELQDTAVHLRFATLMGVSPFMRFDLLPHSLIWSAVTTGRIVLYKGDDRRTFFSLENACEVYVQALLNLGNLKGEVINIGCVQGNMTKRELALMIQKHTNCKIEEVEGVPDKDCRDYEVNYNKMNRLLFRPAENFDVVIQDLIEITKLYQQTLDYRIST
jgi:nucleoside-diphosphate-sugar epimerase